MEKHSRSGLLTLLVLASSGAGATPVEEAPRRSIRQGETLSGIAREIFGAASRWRELLPMNPGIADPNKIFAGRDILIPMPARPKSTLETPSSEDGADATPPPPEAVVEAAEKEAESIEKVEAVKKARTPQEIRALFDKAAAAFKAKRYDETQLVYAELLARTDDLKAEEILEAHHGRGLSRFHQVGCAAARRDLETSAKDPRFVEETTYFLSLCAVESRDFPKAKEGFTKLVKEQSPKFQEPARFYLGVVADGQDEWTEAESHYLDTIDFAEDKRLVDLSKERLGAMKERRSRTWAENKVLTAFTSFGLGYDSNVVSLPQNLSPSSFGVTSPSSANAMFLGVLEAKNPWVKAVEHRVRYTGVVLHQLRSELVANDLQSHELATSLDRPVTKDDFVGMTLGYNGLFVGRLADFPHYMNVASLDLRWTRVTEAVPGRDVEWTSTLRGSLYDAKVGEGTSTDADGHGYRFGLFRTVREGLVSKAPGFEFECRPADGTDAAYWAASLVGRYELPVGPKDWALKLSNEAALQWTSYYASENGRRDTLLRYTGALARLWAPYFETRLQLTGQMNFSTESVTNRFNRFQTNLTASLFY